MIRISLLGATFSTNNLGVNALSLGAIESFLNIDSKVEITLIDYNKQDEINFDIMISNKLIRVKQLNMRFSKLILQKNHIIRLLFTAVALNICTTASFRERIFSKNKILDQLSNSQIICSIAGGDSFSDIYSYKRLAYIVLPQTLAIFLRKKLVLLPQTIGPFKSSLSKLISKYILKNASLTYSRDNQGLEEIQKNYKYRFDLDKFKFCYDMGFVIEPHNVDNNDTKSIINLKNTSTLVGLNVSGLLYIGGYTKENMFGLNLNYQKLIKIVIKHLITDMGLKVILVPHVLGKGQNEESDDSAISLIFNDMCKTFPEEIITLDADYDQNQIKYIISMCDIFIGSRMHSCIAAVSQSVPAVSLAYSKKFIGVMQSLGMSELVADLRVLSIEQILAVIDNTYNTQKKIKRELNQIIPEVNSYIQNEFKYMLNL